MNSTKIYPAENPRTSYIHTFIVQTPSYTTTPRPLIKHTPTPSLPPLSKHLYPSPSTQPHNFSPSLLSQQSPHTPYYPICQITLNPIYYTYLLHLTLPHFVNITLSPEMLYRTPITSHPLIKLFHKAHFTTPTTSSPQQPHNFFLHYTSIIETHNPTYPKYYKLHPLLCHHTHKYSQNLQSHLFFIFILHIGTLTLLQCGDIKPNLGSTLKLPDIFSPQVHLFYKTYFIPQTISFKPEYCYLYNKFMPLIDIRHPNHSQYKESHKNLHQFAKHYSQYPPHQMLLALITTLHPIPECCKDILQDSQL